jgi:hypothetical protein
MAAFVSVGFVMPLRAVAEPLAEATPVTTTGAYVPTDGMLTHREVRRIRRVSAIKRARPQTAEDTSSVWLFDYIGRLLDHEPQATRRVRPARLAGATGHRTAATAQHIAALPATIVPDVAAARPAQPQPAAQAVSAIVTGAISPGRSPAAQGEAGAEPTELLITAAERSQAKLDLVKLEFASRTYDEPKLSGQQVFELRKDWHVLERARDALSGAEASIAMAAGFEANAYINETTRTIVVAIAGSQDLRRDFFTADVWKALIKAEAPQQFYLAKTYVRSVIQRYQMQGFSTECVGHSLGGGACAYAAAELGIRAVVINPISAGKLPAPARFLVTNYIVDGDIANLIYSARGNEFPGNVQVVNDGRDVVRLMALEKYGQLAGPVLVIRELRAGIRSHMVDNALDLVAAQAETSRPR